MSELGKPPKIARPTAKTLGGSISRPVGSASASARPAGSRSAGDQKAPTRSVSTGRPAPAARPADLPGAAPARRPRPRAGSSAPPDDMNRREKSLVGLGNLLKTKREIHGLTRRDVVVKIKIPLDQLEAIEDGRLSSLPPVFAKGFLRAYANELGLDAETILEDYRQMTGGFKNEPASREPLSARYVESSVGEAQGGSLKALLIALGVLLLLALLLIFWPGLRYTLGSVVPLLDRVPGFTAPVVSSPSDPKPVDPNGGLMIQDPVYPDPVKPPPEDNPFISDPLNKSGDGSVTRPLNVPPPAVPQGGTLVLTSREDKVWVEAVVDEGSREYLLLNAGQAVTMQPTRQVTVTTGQANALNVTWNGQDLGPLSNKTVDEVTFPRR